MFKFYINTAVDSIQSAKKIAIDTLVKNESLATSFNSFVDTQTEYTKKAVDASIAAGTEVYKIVTDKSFYTDALKAAQDAATQFVSKQAN